MRVTLAICDGGGRKYGYRRHGRRALRAASLFVLLRGTGMGSEVAVIKLGHSLQVVDFCEYAR